jgi:hypothetical protein
VLHVRPASDKVVQRYLVSNEFICRTTVTRCDRPPSDDGGPQGKAYLYSIGYRTNIGHAMRQARTVHIPWRALLLPLFAIIVGVAVFLTAEKGARQSRAVDIGLFGRPWAKRAYTKRRMRVQGIIFAVLGLIAAVVIVTINVLPAFR